MPMKNPPHPGHSVRENCLDPHGLSVTEAAEILGVALHTLSRVLNGHAPISPEMTIRLEKAGWSQRRLLDEPPDCIRPGPGAQRGKTEYESSVTSPRPLKGKDVWDIEVFIQRGPPLQSGRRKRLAAWGRTSTSGDIRKQVESGHLGEVVAIDVETGNWTIDAEALDAVEH